MHVHIKYLSSYDDELQNQTVWTDNNKSFGMCEWKCGKNWQKK